ncbi:hypothetical protein QFC22_005367 [Naganishia vaughanmartiniae]|uniref:Uncharacterized protein n=1 Tax=Naganishia vaughanmartiniae TaxID=1424756 RepID=A0ACC2WV94_9TREE|nr:hypothetical protein QFC22_005367 [Naganishia vaughanmartiniae]
MTISPSPTQQDYHIYHDDLPASVVRKDYHRFYLDPTTLPSPKIVGVLACQRDPYLRSLETRILRAEPVGEEAVARSKGVTAQTTNGQPVVKEDGKGKAMENQKGKGKGKTGQGKANQSGTVAGNSTVISSGAKNEDQNVKPEETDLWQLELEDTVLFPEGKLQRFHPAAVGAASLCTLLVESHIWHFDGDSIRLVIQDVFRRGLTALHIVRLPSKDGTQERDIALKALQAIWTSGAIDGGSVCTVTVDWERRYDQMTQHTAQHLLSAITDTHLGLPTLSWFMPPHPSTEPCYIELPRSLMPAEASAMEEQCNQLVTRNWGANKEGQDVRVWIESRLQKRGAASPVALGSDSVKEDTTKVPEKEVVKSTMEQEEAEGLGVLGGIQKGTFDSHDEEQKEWADRESRGLPKDYAGYREDRAYADFLRLVSTSRAFPGDHHPALSKIGHIHVLPPTTASQKPTRLFMLAGHRATRHLIAASGELTRAATVVGCSRSELAGRVEQREQGRREMLRGQEKMRVELANILGGVLRWKTMTDGHVEGMQYAVVTRTEEATHDFEFLSALNVAAVDALKVTSASSNDDDDNVGALPRYALIVHSSVTPASNNNIPEAGSLLLITTNPPELAKSYGDNLKSSLDAIPGQETGRVKGGGAKGRWMGKVTGKWSRADAQTLERLVVA